MAQGCGASCAKFMLIVFNIIFWLSGAALLALGLWIRFDPNVFDLIGLVDVAESDMKIIYAAYVLIAVGAFVLIVGFLGCCGAIKENKCMLGMYIFALFIVFAAELAAGIYVIINKDSLLNDARAFLVAELKSDQYYIPGDGEGDGYTLLGSTMNYAQHFFKCCGVNNYTDYEGSNFTETNNGQKFPFSCCVLKEDTNDPRKVTVENVKNIDSCNAKEEGAFNNQACYDSIQGFVDQNAIILIGLGIGLACLQLFGLIFAICLCQNTSGKDDD